MAVLTKDLRSELRNRAAVNSVLLFSVTALVVVGFATGSAKPSAEVKAALLWIVLFFAAFSGLSHIFLHEEEAGTSMALRLTARPEAIFLGKLLFNLLLMMGIAAVVTPLYWVLLDVRPEVAWGYAAAVAVGCIGLAVAATIVAAIIAKARGKGALYGALGFPILIPLLFMAVDGSRSCLVPGVPLAALVRDLIGMASFAVMLVTASLLLFPYVWED
ncbi:MAG: heme exporter protein CcmB [Chthonomonadales bacterium]